MIYMYINRCKKACMLKWISVIHVSWFFFSERNMNGWIFKNLFIISEQSTMKWWKKMRYMTINCKNEKSSLIGFLAHLSQRLKWAFLIKICPYSVVVVVVVYVAINLLFHLLLQNHWAIFNQTCHKAPFGEGYSSLFKKGII